MKGKKINIKIVISVAIILVILFSAAFILRSVNSKYSKSSYPVKYEKEVTAASEKYGVDISLIYAVIKTESNFNPKAKSVAGAIGLMQITEDTFTWLQTYYVKDESHSFSSLYEPETNIDYGVRLLSILLDKYGNEDTALCAYNGGQGHVDEWLKNPDYSDDGKTLKKVPFPETDNYRKLVAQNKSIYRKLYDFPTEKSYPLKYEKEVSAASIKYGVSKALIYAVIKAESNFDEKAESSVGAKGLMQLMPDTFNWLNEYYFTEDGHSIDEILVPEVNIEYGTRLLSILLEEFGNEEAAVCAYNAGSGNVEQWLSDPQYSDDGKTLKKIPFDETDSYRKIVAVNKLNYRCIYHMTDESSFGKDETKNDNEESESSD